MTLVDAGIRIRRSNEGVVGRLLLQLFVISTLAEFVYASVVNLVVVRNRLVPKKDTVD